MSTDSIQANRAPAQTALPAPQQTTGAPDGATAHLLDYWQILYSRKEIVFAVALLLILAGIVITLRMPQVFSAVSTIEVQRETPNVHLYERVRAGYDPVFLRSQFEIIQSDPVLEQVVEANDLGRIFTEAYRWRPTSPEDARDSAIDLLKRKITLSIRRDTDIIDIEVRLDKPVGQAPALTATVANSIADIFREYTRQVNMAAIEEGLSSLRKEIDDLDRSIDAKEAEISDFRRAHNILLASSNDNGADILRREITELTARLHEARIRAEQEKSLYETILALNSSQADQISVLAKDPTLATLLSQRRDFEMTVSQLKEAGIGDNHDKMKLANEQLRENADKIDNAIQGIKAARQKAWDLAEADAKIVQEHLAELERKEQEISTGPAIQFERMQKGVEELKMRRSQLQGRMDEERVGLKMPKTSVRPVQKAKPSDRPVSPNFALNVSLSVAAGIFFGILLAFFVEYLDTTVKTVDDVEKYLQANVLGVIPQKMRALNDPNARAKHSEVYRVLRMNVKSSRALGNGKAIVFTSASAGEGKSTTSFNVAWICAEVGEKVLLVDGDLHRPRQHKILGVPLEPGLANVAVGEADVDSAIVKTPQHNLDFLPAGSIDSSSIYGLMDTDEMTALLQKLRDRYDRIIIDAPPMIGISDTAQLARLGDGVVLIVQHRKYPRALCKRAKDSIITMGGNFLGVVLNNVNAAHDTSSYYYEHQYYYYYYTRDASGKTRRTRRASSRRGGGESSPAPADGGEAKS